MLETELKRCVAAAVPLLRPLRNSGDRRMAETEAIRALRTDSSPATLVFAATEALLGQVFLSWEPESIWLGLNDKDVDVSEINRNKLLAVGTLIQIPSFYNDANLFEDTCLAFDSAPVIVDVLQEASPAQLSWGVFEAQVISMGREDPATYQFDHEPRQYTALSLYRDGLVLAPSLLVFCQEELDGLSRSGAELKQQVLRKWNSINATPDTNLLDLSLDESPLDTQIAKLAAIELCLEARAKNFIDSAAKTQL